MQKGRHLTAPPFFFSGIPADQFFSNFFIHAASWCGRRPS